MNIKSDEFVWRDHYRNNPSQCNIKVGNSNVVLKESNMGSLQLICVGIETFGRIMNGFRNESGKINGKAKSEIAFTSFLNYFQNKKYNAFADELYKRYRCGLLHSFILGYDDKNLGFAPVRGNCSWHLIYTTKNIKFRSETKSNKYFRLVINIDRFYKDFKEAVEGIIDKFQDNLLTKDEYNNIAKSVKNLNEDT